jgi:hypothetical protein
MKAPLTFIAVVVSFGVASVGAIAPAAAQESAAGAQQFSYVVHQVSRSDLQGHNSTTTSFGYMDWYFRTHHYAFSFQTLLVD